MNESRAGVITFSADVEHSIKLRDHFDITSFSGAVDRIPHMAATTRIDKALRLAQKEMFSLPNGARPGIPKILILLTDGTQTKDADTEDPSVIANEIRKKGVKTLVIGVGKGVNPFELVKLVESDRNVFSVSNFDELISNTFVELLTKISCEVGKYYVMHRVFQLEGKGVDAENMLQLELT